MSPRQPDPAYDIIGTRPPRFDAADKVTGRAVFGADVKLPGMLCGKILRSPHAHARIVFLDTSRAAALPGVLAIVTAADLPRAEDRTDVLGEGTVNYKYQSDSTMASDKVLYHGHPVAAVAARTETIAEEALRLIRVEYDILPPVMDVAEAMKANAPLLHEHMITKSLAKPGMRPSNIASHFQHVLGDLEAGFAQADVVVEREFRSVTVHQGYLEPQVTVAVWGPDDRITLYTCTQGPFDIRSQVANLLHWPMSQIRVIPTEVGGAFGGKNTSFTDVPAALLARKSGRPVKVAMSRAEVLLATGPTPGGIIRVKIGATGDGRITAARAELWYEAGAYPGSPVGAAANTMFAAYDIANGQIDGYDVVVNKPRMGAYRAPGATPANFAVETLVDELAEKIDMDPIDFRLLNCAREGTRRLTGTLHASIGVYQVLQAAKQHPHYGAPLSGRNRGRGIALGFWTNWGAQSSCLIHVNSDGTVALVTGSVDITGTRTSLAMQAAEILGLPLDQIRSSFTDTDAIGYGNTSAGSRTTMATGIAAIKAAQDVIAQMSERAAMLWGVPSGTVSYHKGTFTCSADHSLVAFKDLAGQLGHSGGTVTGNGNVNVQDWGAGCGLHMADVEVDPETGKVTILRYTTVQDVGRAIHPGQVEGQMQGGATQGIGWALYEGYAYGADGRLLNTSLLDYKMPTFLDVPPIDTVIVEAPWPGHPFGVRGVGEVPIVMPPAALGNAIYRAIGARQSCLPMTPATILESMGVI